jgi:hypothetical protein
VNAVTIILVGGLLALLVTGVLAAGLDLSKIGWHALDLRRARRACRRGWDWPAFERELASYAARRRGYRHAPHRRR